MEIKPRILIVDDERSNIHVLDEILRDDYDIMVALTGKQAIRRAGSETPPELILLDIQMPEMDGFAVCTELQSRPETREIPIIFITAMSNQKDEQRGLELGAVDYVTKPFHPAIVQARIRIHLDLKRQRDILSRISGIDGLTGVANRRRLDQFLDFEWRRCIRTGSFISFLMMDIDHFKEYNDHYGHMAGDDCLREIASVLAANAARQTDLVARFGGEEFACVMPETDIAGAITVAKRMLQAVTHLSIPHAFSPIAPQVTISAGVATLAPAQARDNPRTLIEKADHWLYNAKRNGRNQVAWDPDVYPLPPGMVPSRLHFQEPEKTHAKPLILLVDDERINLNVLEAIFKDECDTDTATSGEQALMRASDHPKPDMILLDIQMPHMDGYSVCQILKNDPSTRDIPLMFITILTEGADQSRGFALGAVDYITKPFHPAVVLARVKTHLRLKNALNTLSERNRELENMLNLRASVERIVRCDFKKPLEEIMETAYSILEKPAYATLPILEFRKILSQSFHLMREINRSVDLWKLERNIYPVFRKTVDISRIIGMVRMEMDDSLRKANVNLEYLAADGTRDPEASFLVYAEKLLCCSLVDTILMNALDTSVPGGTIGIFLKNQEGDRLFQVRSSGVIPVDLRNRMLEKGFGWVKSDPDGIRTYLARLIAEVLGGCLEVESTEDAGTVQTLRIPAGYP